MMNLQEATINLLYTEGLSEDNVKIAIDKANTELKNVKTAQELLDLVEGYYWDKFGLGFPLYLISRHHWCLYSGSVIDEYTVRFLVSDSVSIRKLDARTAYKYYRFSYSCRGN